MLLSVIHIEECTNQFCHLLWPASNLLLVLSEHCHETLFFSGVFSLHWYRILFWSSCCKVPGRCVCHHYTKFCHKLPLSTGTTWVEDFGSWGVTPWFAWLPAYKSFPELLPSQGFPKLGWKRRGFFVKCFACDAVNNQKSALKLMEAIELQAVVFLSLP